MGRARRRYWHVCLALATLFVPAAALAEPAISWSAPRQHCPDEAAFRQQLQRFLGRPLAEHEEVLRGAEIVVQHLDTGFAAQLTISTDAGQERREVSDPQCQTLMQAAAFIVATVLDPELALNDPGLPLPVDAGPEPAQGAPRSQPEQRESRSEARTETPPRAPGSLRNRPARTSLAPDRLQLQIGPAVVFGLMPQIAFGGQLAGGVAWDRISTQLELDYWIPQEQERPELRARYSAVSLGIELCYAAVAHATEDVLQLCVGALGGQLHAQPISGGTAAGELIAQSQAAWYSAALATGVVRWPRWGWGALRTTLRGGLNWVRPRFTLENVGDVHRVGALQLGAFSGLEVWWR